MTTQEAQAPGLSPAEAQRIIGEKGLAIWGGYITEEYLAALKPWTKEVRVYHEMRDDATIGTVLDAIKLPLLAADFTVNPMGEQQADKDAAAWLWENMNHMDAQTWRSYVMDAMEVLDFGFHVGEIVLEKRGDGRLWLKNILPLGQETLSKWELDDDKVPVGFVQRAFPTAAIFKPSTIPLAKCVHATFRGRKGSPQGRSLLRSLYRPWKYLRNMQNLEGIKIERDTGGMPIAQLPETPPTAEALNDLKAALKAMRIDEAMYLLEPHGVAIRPYQGAGPNYPMRDTIESYRKEIFMRVFAQFLLLGMDKGGTQALVKGSQDFYSLGLLAVQQILVDVWNQQLIPYLMSFNDFPGLTACPVMAWSAPGVINLTALMDAYTKGSSSGLITVMRQDEEKMRSKLDMPDLPADVGNEPRSPRSVFPPPGGDGGNGAFPFQAIGFPYGAPIKMQEPLPQGRSLRTPTTKYARFSNSYQKELISMYDGWRDETMRLVELPGRTPATVQELLDGRMNTLEVDMKMLGRRRISEASGLGLGRMYGKRASSPTVIAKVAELIQRNDHFIESKLIPDLRLKFKTDIVGALATPDPALRSQTLTAVLNAPRARVASYSGGAVVAAFESQKVAGKEEDQERRSNGAAPVSVRWTLEPGADHCQDDPNRGTFGCISLARTYSGGWDELSTVPAGNVSCLGSCKCFLEFDLHDGSGFRRFD